MMLSNTQLTTPGLQRESGIPASRTKANAQAARKPSGEVGAKKGRDEKKPKPAPKPTGKNRAGSKQDRVLSLLRRPDGATLDLLVKATGWQRHSIRGFLAGTVRKRLKLPLRSEKIDGARVYRIGASKPGGPHERAVLARPDDPADCSGA